MSTGITKHLHYNFFNFNFSYENYLSCKNIVIQFYTFDHPLKKPFIVVKVSRRHSFFSLFVFCLKNERSKWDHIVREVYPDVVKNMYMYRYKEIGFSKCFAKGLNSNLSTLKPYLGKCMRLKRRKKCIEKVNKHKKLIWIFRPWNCKLPWEWRKQT